MCVLIIMFLLTLKKEQCKKMTNIKDYKLIVLNDDNNNKKTRINIKEENYTHNKLKDYNFWFNERIDNKSFYQFKNRAVYRIQNKHIAMRTF